MSAELLQRKEEVHGILGTIERYNPNSLDQFTEYIRLTMAENTYDIDAYLALLKLFQFHPDTFDIKTTCAILTKSIMSMPDNDFFLCLCLLSPSKMEERSVQQIVYLSQALETCRFSDFWTYLDDHPELLKPSVRFTDEDNDDVFEEVELKGFRDNIRACEECMHVAASTLTAMLGGLEGSDLERFASAQGWQAKGENYFIGNKEDVIKSKNIVENISFDALVPLMASSQVR